MDNLTDFEKFFEDRNYSTILDFVLTLPIDYQDNRISHKITLNQTNTLKAIIVKKSVKNGILRVYFRISITKMVTGIFFNAVNYYNRLLEPEDVVYIQGVIKNYKGFYQIVQPKILQENQVRKIVPIYSKDRRYNRLISNIFKEARDFLKERLPESKLNQDEMKNLYFLHYPRDIEDTKIDTKTLKLAEALNHLEKLSKKRRDFKAIESLNGDESKFIKNLPFELTGDQKRAIADIKRDLGSKKATRRLIIGDVGSGKTMVILASAMVAYPKKSILMAPTSILAVQLYQEAQKFLPKEVKVSLVKQGSSNKNLDADFIIGTHALLFKENLPEAPLIMIDEQHRFGTKQRALLERLVSTGEKRPHFLQFSATPIPRTQAMMLSKLIDVTLIEEIPFKKKVETKVIGRADFPKLLEKIKEEISKNHQILIIYPLVEESQAVPYQSIDEGRAFWESRFEKVYVTHGKDRDKEDILLKFREDGNILLATTVVEVGISLPRLTLIVIVGAERLGLATLHQLRGRVGRVGLDSFCYLFTNDTENRRLKAFCKTTSGFDIAKLDLKFRNAGDILDGTIQSGVKFKWLNLAEDEDIIEEAKRRINSKVTYKLLFEDYDIVSCSLYHRFI